MTGLSKKLLLNIIFNSGVNMYTNEETKETNGINVNQNLAHEYYKETKKYYLNNMGFNLYNYINQMVINNTTSKRINIFIINSTK